MTLESYLSCLFSEHRGERNFFLWGDVDNRSQHWLELLFGGELKGDKDDFFKNFFQKSSFYASKILRVFTVYIVLQIHQALLSTGQR